MNDEAQRKLAENVARFIRGEGSRLPHGELMKGISQIVRDHVDDVSAEFESMRKGRDAIVLPSIKR